MASLLAPVTGLVAARAGPGVCLTAASLGLSLPGLELLVGRLRGLCGLLAQRRGATALLGGGTAPAAFVAQCSIAQERAGDGPGRGIGSVECELGCASITG